MRQDIISEMNKAFEKKKNITHWIAEEIKNVMTRPVY